MLFVCHPTILHKHCLQFLLGVKMAPRETENNAYAKLWGDKQNQLTAMKHTYQLRGMASTLRMRTTISPGQWQPWTAVSPLLGLISMA